MTAFFKANPSSFNDPEIREWAEEELARLWTVPDKQRHLSQKERLFNALTTTPQSYTRVRECAGIGASTPGQAQSIRRSLSILVKEGRAVSVKHRGHMLYAKA